MFRFHEPEGDLRNFYCNINQPPVFRDNVLDYIDLDIDVLVWKDFSHQILDVDEFDHHALKYKYPKHLREKVATVLEKLLKKIEKKSFPFDYKN